MSTQTLAQPATLVERRKFTAAEFLHMYEAGIFSEEERMELLEGELYVMSPIGPLHGGTVDRLTAMLVQMAGSAAIVRVQNPVLLDDYSQPQPDFALLRPRDDYYTGQHPGPDEVFLLIEVSHSSLEYDRRLKLPLYAAAGVPEVWIVDLNKRQIEQFTQPHAGQYKKHATISRGEQIAATQFPAVAFNIDQLFTP